MRYFDRSGQAGLYNFIILKREREKKRSFRSPSQKNGPLSKNAPFPTPLTDVKKFGWNEKMLHVNFTNILREAFTRADPKSAKRYRWLDLIFTLLGSVRKKSFEFKMLMKLTLGRGDGGPVAKVTKGQWM